MRGVGQRRARRAVFSWATWSVNVVDFEQLGIFYLGKHFDPAQKKLQDDLLLYDSRDLVTHAVCVGMTGSGKTGLCLTLLEEAAIDGIPAVVIDPKGDLANLLLTFPELRPADFEPWINADDARQAGQTPADFAARQADSWRQGLAEWGQDGARIARLRAAADFAVYTPGSTAGLSVSVVNSFAAPPAALADDVELWRDRIAAAANSLLGLLGIDGDPLQSREHILLATILDHGWRAGQDLDLPSLVQHIQHPPVERVGVVDLESFFPAQDRFELAMRLNNLLASPGFGVWLEGEPLDLNRLLYTAERKPRVAIFSIAHLGDAERMFFVSLLLNQTLSWMRGLSGTTSLRALVYMDEIAGYFPPVANPPSKRPLLTLLKQARAFGVGVVLATQNPVDLDYKGLTNTGTWFIGRLQTERDQARLMDGLEGIASSASMPFDREATGRTLAGLTNRVFLMHNVHDDAPAVFQVRWALSYLRGPLTRDQIKLLKQTRPAVQAAASPAAAPAMATASTPAVDASAPQVVAAATATEPAGGVSAGTVSASGAASGNRRPVLPPDVPQYFLPCRAPAPPSAQLWYQPRLLGVAKLHFTDKKCNVQHTRGLTAMVELGSGPLPVDWQALHELAIEPSDLQATPAEDALFDPVSAEASRPKSYSAWKKSFADALYRDQRLELVSCPKFDLVSQPGESSQDFRLRVEQRAREERDLAVAALRAKFTPKVDALEERKRKASQAVDREKEQATQQKLGSVISLGATVLGAFLGRKRVSVTNLGKAATSIKGLGRNVKESQDVARAEDNVATLNTRLEELNQEFEQATEKLQDQLALHTADFDSVTIKPRKVDVVVDLVALLWLPHWRSVDGLETPAWA